MREISEDYGDALVPRFVERGPTVHFPLEGYWRDVGRMDSYWQGHMDLLGAAPAFELDRPDWPLRTRELQRLPARIRKGAQVQDSLVAPGADVRGEVLRSVIGPGVRVEAGAVVQNAVLLPGAHVKAGAEVYTAVLDERSVVGKKAVVGAKQDRETPEIALVGMEAEIAEGQRVEAGAQVPAAEAV